MFHPVCIVGHAGGLAKRVIACLDVRANDAGDLVVTKGDQYDVRETVGGKEVPAHAHDAKDIARTKEEAKDD